MAEFESPTIIRLPSSAEKLQEIIHLFVAERILTRVKGDFPNEVQKILKYTIPCLSNGRPFNQVKIIVAGDDDTYKRAVVSMLIDNKLPHTPVKVTPNGIRYYSDSLEIPDGDISVEVGITIDMLDICTHLNHKIENHVSNASRTYIPNRAVRKITPELRKLASHCCRPVEYPNLVLYFAKSEVALKSQEQKNILNFQLSQLHKMNLVDTKANNLVLIIVDDVPNKESPVQLKSTATNPPVGVDEVDADGIKQKEATNPSTSTAATRNKAAAAPPLKYSEMQKMIQKQLKRVYGLTGEVPVLVFDSSSLKPDRGIKNTESRNLILNSVTKVFTVNNDFLGLLVLSKLCEQEISNIRASLEEASGTSSLDANALNSIFGFDNTNPTRSLYRSLVSPPKHSGFHSIGQAYCPVSETLKMQNVFSKYMMKGKNVFVGETMFYIPEFVEMFLDTSTESWSLAHNSKKSYEAYRKSEYGIEKGVTLRVDTSLRGNWRSSSGSSDSSDAVLHEVRLAFLQVMNPDDFCSQEIKDELRDLKKDIDPKLKKKEIEQIKVKRYNSFFAKWGTHFVVKQWIGGYIKTDKTENKENSKSTSSLFGQLAAKFLGLGKGISADQTSKASLFSVKKGGKLAISGHEHDDLVYLEFDKITPELYYGWVNEVKKNPNALNYSFVLYPYYNSKFCKDKDELRIRTLKYLAKKQGCEGCFPASTMIRLSNGQEKSIGQLQEFDALLTVFGTSNCEQICTLTKFLTFVHIERNKKAEFLLLTFSNGKRLKVTKNHLLFVLDQSHNAPIISKQARYVKLGDKLLYVNQNQKISTMMLETIEVEEDYGVFCPLTFSGSFLANGFLVTSYASVGNFSLAHKAMIPLRIWYDFKFVFNKIIGRKETKGNQLCQGVHDYAKLLVWIRSFF